MRGRSEKRGGSRMAELGYRHVSVWLTTQELVALDKARQQGWGRLSRPELLRRLLRVHVGMAGPSCLPG